MCGMRYITQTYHSYHSGVNNETVLNKVEMILNKKLNAAAKAAAKARKAAAGGK